MSDGFSTLVPDLFGRLHGPFSFRFVLQPAMAIFCATRDGLADARAGRPPYFWSLFTRPGQRIELLHEGWEAVARVTALGAIMDMLYQLLVLQSIHPLEMAIVVFGLAIAPYLLWRGPVERIASWWATRQIHTKPRSIERNTHP